MSTVANDADVQACKNFDNNNRCVNDCPREYIYSPTLFKQVPNPDAKYAYGSLCVDKCPRKSCLPAAHSSKHRFQLLNFDLQQEMTVKNSIRVFMVCIHNVRLRATKYKKA